MSNNLNSKIFKLFEEMTKSLYKINEFKKLPVLLDITDKIISQLADPNIRYFDDFYYFFRILFNLKVKNIDNIVLEYLNIFILNNIIKGNELNDSLNIELKNNKLIINKDILHEIKIKNYNLVVVILKDISNLYELNDVKISNLIVKLYYNLYVNYQYWIRKKNIVFIISNLFIIYFRNIKNEKIASNIKTTIFEITKILFQRIEVNSYYLPIQNKIINLVNKEDFQDIFDKKLFINKKTNYVFKDTISDYKIKYCDNLLKNMIDTVDLYNSKKKIIEYGSDNIKIVKNNFKDFNTDIINTNIMILNEKNNENGLFGWCFICRKKADFYCKEERLPICSLNCKFNLNTIIKNCEKKPKLEKKSENCFLEDGYRILKYWYELIYKNKEKPIVKIFVYEILLSIFNNIGPYFQYQNDTIKKIKNHFIQGLIKDCVSNNEQIFKLSIIIFIRIFENFKSYIKNEISIFFEEILFKILVTNNFNFNQKSFVLKSLKYLFSNPKYLGLLYINYDCTINEKSIVENYIKILVKLIYNLILSKNNSYIWSNNDNKQIANLALISWVELLNNIKKFFDSKNQFNFYNYKINFNLNKENEFIGKIESERKDKIKIENAIELFNFKYKKGFELIINSKIIANNPKEIAQFFLNYKEKINKIKLGEFLGDSAELNIKILEEFLRFQDYKNKKIDEAYRICLDKFELPVGGEKVERIIQKFSEKYSSDNPEIETDCCFSLSYLLMMLQTETYNPNVEEYKKMNYEQFYNLSKNCLNFGKQLGDELLKHLFTSIKNKPLGIPSILKETFKIENSKKLTKNELQQEILDNQKEMITITESKIKESKNIKFINYLSVDIYKYLINEILEPNSLVTLSTIFESIDEDNDLVNIIIKGLYKLLVISSNKSFNNPYYFSQNFNAVYRLSGLDNNLRQLKLKNVILLNKLLKFIHDYSNRFIGNWKKIIQLLLNIQYFIKVLKDRDPNISETEKENGILIKNHVKWNLISQIYLKIEKENESVLLEVIHSLIEINIKEINKNKIISTLCLTKIIEIAEFNMFRTTLNWKKIWEIITDFFKNYIEKVDYNTKLIMIDGLKQLTSKILSKNSTIKYEYQSKILLTYKVIYLKCSFKEKIFLIECLKNIVEVNLNNINNGWPIIFEILDIHLDNVISIEDKENTNIILGNYELLIMIINNYINILNKEDFLENILKIKDILVKVSKFPHFIEFYGMLFKFLILNYNNENDVKTLIINIINNLILNNKICINSFYEIWMFWLDTLYNNIKLFKEEKFYNFFISKIEDFIHIIRFNFNKKKTNQLEFEQFKNIVLKFKELIKKVIIISFKIENKIIFEKIFNLIISNINKDNNDLYYFNEIILYFMYESLNTDLIYLNMNNLTDLIINFLIKEIKDFNINELETKKLENNKNNNINLNFEYHKFYKYSELEIKKFNILNDNSFFNIINDLDYFLKNYIFFLKNIDEYFCYSYDISIISILKILNSIINNGFYILLNEQKINIIKYWDTIKVNFNKILFDKDTSGNYLNNNFKLLFDINLINFWIKRINFNLAFEENKLNNNKELNIQLVLKEFKVYMVNYNQFNKLKINCLEKEGKENFNEILIYNIMNIFIVYFIINNIISSDIFKIKLNKKERFEIVKFLVEFDKINNSNNNDNINIFRINSIFDKYLNKIYNIDIFKIIEVLIKNDNN